MEEYWIWKGKVFKGRVIIETKGKIGLDSRKGMWGVSKLGEHIQYIKTLCRNTFGDFKSAHGTQNAPMDTHLSQNKPKPLQFNSTWSSPGFSILISSDYASYSLLSRHIGLLSGPETCQVQSTLPQSLCIVCSLCPWGMYMTHPLFFAPMSPSLWSLLW